MNNHLYFKTVKYLKDNTLNFFPVDYPNKKVIFFVKNLYCDEPFPIFEHNHYHIISYLHFKAELLGVNFYNGSCILSVGENNLNFFTPIAKDIEKLICEFLSLLKYLKISNSFITHVSRYRLIKWQKSLTKFNFSIINRSREEVVYDISTLVELKGKDFAKLRNTRNKLLNKNKLKFIDINGENLQIAFNIVDLWNDVQGFKYQKKKDKKEKYVIKILSNIAKRDENLNTKLVFWNNIPVGLIIYFVHPYRKDWGEIYMVKCINRSSDGGIHGASDASYLKIFEDFKNSGVKWVNDGDLGIEEGTREHKLRFKPIRFLQSFDISISL